MPNKIIDDYMAGRRERDAEVEAALRAEELADPAYLARRAAHDQEMAERKAWRDGEPAREAFRQQVKSDVARVTMLVFACPSLWLMLRKVLHRPSALLLVFYACYAGFVLVSV